MIKDELDYVHKAMRMDLSDVIDWNKCSDFKQDYPDSIPYSSINNSQKEFEQYWKDVSSEICHIGEALQVSDDTAVLRIALGCDSLSDLVQKMNGSILQINPSVSYLWQDQSVVRKLVLIAHNYNEIKVHIMKKESEEAEKGLITNYMSMIEDYQDISGKPMQNEVKKVYQKFASPISEKNLNNLPEENVYQS